MSGEATRSSALLRDLGTIPNLLSLSRVLLAAGAVACIGLGRMQATVWLLAASAGVDILDGYLARRWDMCTELGAILDRATDLMMESVTLYAAVLLDAFPFWILFVYLFREFTVTSARMYMASIGAKIPKSTLGQRKTNLIMGGFITFGLLQTGGANLGTTLNPIMYEVGRVGLVVGLCASYLSMLVYLRALDRSYR